MARLLERILGFLGLEETASDAPPDVLASPARPVKNNVVSLPSPRPARLVIARPYSFDQAEEVGEYLRTRQPVLLNLDRSEAAVARRLLDFLSGVVYALGGSVEKVSEGIFVLAPPNVEIDRRDGGTEVP
ncbi:MAG: cell division protein SepF [Clostridia bacterium]|nr:cell division protein SepF [Clostridia bacterium]MBC7346104.1 cell division protein SepF [Clostridia bacterium]